MGGRRAFFYFILMAVAGRPGPSLAFLRPRDQHALFDFQSPATEISVLPRPRAPPRLPSSRESCMHASFPPMNVLVHSLPMPSRPHAILIL